MSVVRDRPEVAGRRQNDAIDPKRTLVLLRKARFIKVVFSSVIANERAERM
jgi:hypothetical protein